MAALETHLDEAFAQEIDEVAKSDRIVADAGIQPE